MRVGFADGALSRIQNNAFTAAVNRSATQKQVQLRLFARPARDGLCRYY